MNDHCYFEQAKHHKPPSNLKRCWGGGNGGDHQRFLFGVTKMLWNRIVVKAANHGTGHFKIVHLMYVIISQNGKKANPNRGNWGLLQGMQGLRVT